MSTPGKSNFLKVESKISTFKIHKKNIKFYKKMLDK